MSGSTIFSNLLGYTSIACWLCSQFPQVIKNLRRRSCDGLALPFLANWFLGDFSNLIGCILTHQLPFQKYLATYFVFIDCVLLAQYLYYESPTKAPVVASPTSYSHCVTSTPGARRLSVDRKRYRTLSAVAANVAAAAALAAQQNQEIVPHGRHEDLILDIEGDGDGATALADSFHSEGGRGIGQKRVSWSIERHGVRARSVGRLSTIAPSLISPMPPVVGVINMKRGRSLGRETEQLEDPEERTVVEPISSPSTTAIRRNSRVGKKSATMVFLSVWALFGVGTLVGSRRVLPTGTLIKLGKVLSPLNVRVPANNNIPVAVTTTLPTAGPLNIPSGIAEMTLTFEDQDPPLSEPTPPSQTPPSTERIIGRIFAWLCTTLYLTSRLPQIWKNYVRKSVEGLSMYLFVFAFLGNVFYVASILFSPNAHQPPPKSTEFLKESIPYLLGSAGTLMFDVTIVSQSFVYMPRHKSRHARSRSNTATLEVGIAEEHSGLLAGDTLARHRHSSHAHTDLPPLHTAGAVDVGDDTMTRGRTTQMARSLSDSG